MGAKPGRVSPTPATLNRQAHRVDRLDPPVFSSSLPVSANGLRPFGVSAKHAKLTSCHSTPSQLQSWRREATARPCVADVEFFQFFERMRNGGRTGHCAIRAGTTVAGRRGVRRVPPLHSRTTWKQQRRADGVPRKTLGQRPHGRRNLFGRSHNGKDTQPAGVVA